MSISYRSYHDLNKAIVQNIGKIIKYKFDLVVGIPRSGMIPAYMIALYLNTHCCTFEQLRDNCSIEKTGSRTIGQYSERFILPQNIFPHEAHRILIIEDSYGKGLKLASLLESLPSNIRTKCIVGAIYSAAKEPNLDFYFEFLPKPRCFEWNIYHHIIILRSAFDIDGVLCEDPSSEENDDGQAYEAFLANACPKIIPSLPIHTIVTSRLEKYRAQTEFWLHRNNVKYNNLIMLDLPSKEERKRLNSYASHKAAVYMNPELSLFFESSTKQAEEIFRLTGKPVFCVENNCIYSN